jgi:hypothetical protein
MVKELRLAGISTIREANRFLRETYLPKMNGKFTRPAVSREDAHVPRLDADLTDIFCFEYELTISNDYEEETGRHDKHPEGCKPAGVRGRLM